jgi:hypothetical protein
MAYEFNGTSQYLDTQSSPISGYPLTMFFRGTGRTQGRAGMVVTVNSGANPDRHQVSYSSGGVIAAASVVDPNSGAANTSTGVATNTPFAALGVYSSSTSRTAYLNGGEKVSNATNLTPTGFNAIGIAARFASSWGSFFDGRMSDVAIWNDALTDDEAVSLAKGFKAYRIRPQSLVFYAPLIRTLQDLRGGLTITNNNSATVARHPRVY